MKAGKTPPAPPPLDEATKAIRREAAEWLALRLARALTVAEAAALTDWCAADPRHAAMFREVEAADRVFDRLAFYPRPPDWPADPDLLVRRRSLRPGLLAWAAAAAALAVVGWTQLRPPPPVPRGNVAGLRSHFLRLPDGSRVELNRDSEVAEHFTAAERRVRLVRGEAHFEVAKNPQRPFIVEADHISVRAVGTAFDVRLGATAVDVLVTEGKVGVTTAADRGRAVSAGAPATALGPGLILVAGQRTSVPTAPSSREPARLVVQALTPHEIDRALTWQNNQLVFEAMPLSEVVAWFNRSAAERDGPAAVRLKIRGPSLGALRISGRIRYDSIETFVDVLGRDFGVAVERRGSEITLRRDR